MAYSARKKTGGFRTWRITRTKDPVKAFSGEGAREHGGRWNWEGYRAVYTAGSLSLCTLEILVHVDPEDLPSDYHCFEVEIPKGILVERIEAGQLPRNWRKYPFPPATRKLGTDWIRKGTTAVLSVPSAVIPEERLFVLNPEHPDSRKIRISGARPFSFDSRLVDKTH